MRRTLWLTIASFEFVGTVSIGLIVWLVAACCWAAWLFVAAIREGLPRAAAVWKARVGYGLREVSSNAPITGVADRCSATSSLSTNGSRLVRFESWVN